MGTDPRSGVRCTSRLVLLNLVIPRSQHSRNTAVSWVPSQTLAAQCSEGPALGHSDRWTAVAPWQSSRLCTWGCCRRPYKVRRPRRLPKEHSSGCGVQGEPCRGEGTWVVLGWMNSSLQVWPEWAKVVCVWKGLVANLGVGVVSRGLVEPEHRTQGTVTEIMKPQPASEGPRMSQHQGF